MSLFMLTLEYGNGTRTQEIVKGPVKIYPQRDDIVFSNSKRFKYHVKPYPAVGLITVNNQRFIVGTKDPGWVPCHRDTTLDDIVLIKDKVKKENIEIKQDERWEFKSSSSDSYYYVIRQMNKLKCDCPGYWRAKGKCKHVKEVEQLLK